MSLLDNVTILTATFLDSDYLLLNHNQLGLQDNTWVMLNRKEDGDVLSERSDLRLIEGVADNEVELFPPISKPSCQHGQSLNKGIKHLVETNQLKRFLWILDSDLFIFYKPLEAIFHHIVDNDLAFFGGPFTFPEYGKKYWSHDRQYEKAAGFPCHFCQIVDTEKINPLELDYRPRKNDTSSRVFETFYNEAWDIAPYAGAIGGNSEDRRSLRKELYRFNNQLFGIHFRNRTYEKSGLFDRRYELAKEFIDNLDNNEEVVYIIDGHFFGDGSWPNDIDWRSKAGKYI